MFFFTSNYVIFNFLYLNASGWIQFVIFKRIYGRLNFFDNVAKQYIYQILLLFSATTKPNNF